MHAYFPPCPSFIMTEYRASEAPYSHLLVIETHSAAGTAFESSYLDIEMVPLNSIVEVQEELRRRYAATTNEPLLSADESSSLPVGCVFTYEQEKSEGSATSSTYRDLVRVYQFPEQPIAPIDWGSLKELTGNQREDDLSQAIRCLLASPDLNLDNLEPATIKAIQDARKLLDK